MHKQLAPKATNNESPCRTIGQWVDSSGDTLLYIIPCVQTVPWTMNCKKKQWRFKCLCELQRAYFLTWDRVLPTHLRDWQGWNLGGYNTRYELGSNLYQGIGFFFCCLTIKNGPNAEGIVWKCHKNVSDKEGKQLKWIRELFEITIRPQKCEPRVNCARFNFF